MLLILGGTTEGRKAVQLADGAGKKYYYSTVGNDQVLESAHAVRLTGGMQADEMELFCRENKVALLVDAAHPFAVQLHETVDAVSRRLSLPVVRYERRYAPRDASLVWCSSYAEAAGRLQADGIQHLLALTGVKTICKLRPYWEKRRCWFRILDRKESVALAVKEGFPAERLVFFHEGEDEALLLHQLRPDAILTKESGESGFFHEKVAAARQYGIPVYVIQRPALPDTFIPVDGTEGLRKAIERLAPGFFPLRSGYTTGACATAAAKAALLALLTQQEQTESPIVLPGGETVNLPVAATRWNENSAQCTVIKDAGDDPDVTNGCSVVATVTLVPAPDAYSSFHISFKGGEGVGTVTLPGLGLEIGGPAINATPRRSITEALTALAGSRMPGYQGEIIVTLSVPGGCELAARTFNPKVGIVGGISIIGTSGIVRPFSNEAFVASIRKEAEVAKAIGCQTLIINSGAKSERFLKTYLEKSHAHALPSQAFVHYGNFIGETLKIASDLHFPHLILGIMIGKAVKLAEGALDTHSKKVVMNKAFLCRLASEAGCSEATIHQIGGLTLARELEQILTATEQSRFLPLLLQKCREHCTPLFPAGNLSILLIEEAGAIRFWI